MKKNFLIALCLLLSVSAAAWADSFIVVIEQPGTGTLTATEAKTAASVASSVIGASGISAQKITPLPYLGMAIVETDAMDALERLKNTDRVLTAEPSRKVKAIGAAKAADPRIDKQWHHDPIETLAAWNTTSGDASVIVAVVDSGINYNHEDLAGAMWTDSSGNHGYNAIDGSGNVMDVFGHGTHVAGIIAATANDNNGVSGVAPGVRIMAMKVLGDSGTGSNTDVLKAMNMIIQKKSEGVNVRIANFSLGNTSPADKPSVTEQNAFKALANSGVICFFAAGNSDRDNDDLTNGMAFPSSYGTGIAVGGTNNFGASSVNAKSASPENWGGGNGSSYGAKTVHIYAPGTSIYSTVVTGYTAYNGTSMASPMAAGVGALILSARPDIKNWGTVLKIMTDSGVSAPALSGKCTSGKVINARAAVARALTVTSEESNPKPTDISGVITPTASPSPSGTVSSSSSSGCSVGWGILAIALMIPSVTLRHRP